jgi:hypothetical protein
VRIFISFNSKDMTVAEAVRVGLSRLEPKAEFFFSPISLGQGFWLPKHVFGNVQHLIPYEAYAAIAKPADAKWMR